MNMRVKDVGRDTCGQHRAQEKIVACRAALKVRQEKKDQPLLRRRESARASAMPAVNNKRSLRRQAVSRGGQKKSKIDKPIWQGKNAAAAVSDSQIKGKKRGKLAGLLRWIRQKKRLHRNRREGKDDRKAAFEKRILGLAWERGRKKTKKKKRPGQPRYGKLLSARRGGNCYLPAATE